jgi:parvulin-like peptidyl-prolyl isomerase
MLILRTAQSIAFAALIAVGGCGSDGQRTQSAREVQPLASGRDASAKTAPILSSASASPGNQPAAPGDDSPVVATLGDITITRDQLAKPLIEGYGLNCMLNLLQLDLARQEAARRKLTVTAADITAEQETTIAKLFKDAGKEEYPQLLDQFLRQQHISRPEFAIFIETNAYLHKIAAPAVASGITEDRLQESFKALYGETVQVRHIQCSNLDEIGEAKRRLAAGEPFEKVARDLSRNARTAPAGGELPPFSRYATGYPENFKDAAFSLKPGEVSDPVQAEGVYHLIKLEKRFEPKAVKYEDVKDSLREDLTDRLTQSAVKQLRGDLVAKIAQSLKVQDPVLAPQYEAKKNQTDTAVHGKTAALDAIKRDQSRAAAEAEAAATQPGAGDTSTAPRPPATMPGEASPGGTLIPATKPTSALPRR